jgi:UDP-2,3-diacylglucosamine pyrophosphatase LpxH
MRYDLRRCAEAHRTDLLWLANMAPADDGFGVVYLVGNHDAGAGPQVIPGVPFRYAREIVADGWRCWHGDDLDPDPGLWRKVGVWGCRALAWIGRRSAAWEDRVQGWIDRLEARGRNGLPDAYRAAAVAVAAREQCRGAVLGHTHVAADGPDYRNAGTWARDGWLLLMADGTWHRWRC